MSLLSIIAEKRTGGATSIKGFIFQCKFAFWKLLSSFDEKDNSVSKYIRFEGIEDLDVSKTTLQNARGQVHQFIQVKDSINTMDAGSFWDKGILQNFAEVYIADKNSSFQLVHNMKFANGYLSRLAEACNKHQGLMKTDLEFWTKKFNEFRELEQVSSWKWAEFDLSDMLKRITFELVSEVYLFEETRKLLISNFGVNTGNEEQFL